MIRFRKYLPLVAVLIAAATLSATPARADFELRTSTDGGTTFTAYFSNDGGAHWFSGMGGTGTNFGTSVSVDSLAISATATNFLSPSKSTMDIHVSGTQAAKTYNILVEASQVSIPTAPPPQTLNWKFTSSSDLAGLTETAAGFVDGGNAFFGGSLKGPAASPLLATTGTLVAPAQGSTSFSTTGSYSWTEQYVLTGSGTLGNQISSDDNQNINNAPAPAGLVLALAGMPVLGLGKWLRRRRPTAAVVA
jgi:hypothetical protein